MLKKCDIEKKLILLKDVKYARKIIYFSQKTIFQRYKNRRYIFIIYFIFS